MARTPPRAKPDQRLRYPIRAVSKLTGVSIDALRAWERRYRVVTPHRDERGRLYSDADIQGGRGARCRRSSGFAALPGAHLEAVAAAWDARPRPRSRETR